MNGPLRALGIALATAALTAACAAGSDEPAVGADIREIVEVWYGPSETGGVVAAVGLPDGSIHTEVLGDAAPDQPARADDLMRAGSITKTFVAALALRLDEQGVLSLDDPVSVHLPELGIAEPVTVRHLLSHTSGIGDPAPELLIGEFQADSGRAYDYADLIAFADVPTDPTSSTGSFAYANAGYHVLGGVIERAAGTDVASLLRSEILERAGLSDTYMVGFEELPRTVVPGNVDLEGDGEVDSLADIPYLAVDTYSWTAGAIATTPRDLVTFARSLFDGTLLSQESLDAMTATPPDGGYGLGLVDVGGSWGHNGGAPGYHAVFAHDPGRGLTAALFTNCPACATGTANTWEIIDGLLGIAAAA